MVISQFKSNGKKIHSYLCKSCQNHDFEKANKLTYFLSRVEQSGEISVMFYFSTYSRLTKPFEI